VSTELLLPLYFALVPVILVAGMVQAVRKRHWLGARASNRLVAGAGLLLLLHLGGVLRPLLSRAILDGGFLGGSSDVLAAVWLVQLLAQATGVGLIIAAAFARRPAAEGGEFSEGAGHRPLSRSATRIWTAIAAVVAVLALTAAGSWIIRAVQADAVPPWRMTEDQEAQRCLNDHTPSAQVKGKPVEAMLLRKDGGWLRVYVSKPDNWIIACQGGPQALMSAFATVMEEETPGKLRFYGGYDSVLKGHLLLGKLPNGGAFVEARLADGRTVQGDQNGDIFVVWAPGVSVEGAQVTVTTQDRVVIATAGAPSERD
jgi:hypothetical protein